MGVAGGAIERSCYSPYNAQAKLLPLVHPYVKTERDYERDYQAALPQGRKTAGGCKPRHDRDD